MKWLFKWAFRLVLLLVVLIVVLALSKDAILKALAERQILAQTGMDAKIGRLSVGLLSPVVTIENFKLYNTPEFGGTPFLDIPELHVEYDRAALAERKLHVTLLRFNLAELNVVKNEAGYTNFISLMAKAAAKPASGSGGKRVDTFEFAGVDVLNLSLQKARFIDLKDPRRSRELTLNVRDHVFKNVKSEADLYGVFLLIWLRGGASLNSVPMSSPPEIISVPAPVKK